MKNECIKMYINTLISSEYKQSAFNSYNEMIKTSDEDISDEKMFIQIMKNLPKNCITGDYSKISTDWLSDGGFDLLNDLIKDEYIEKDYLAYLYINRNRNIKNRAYINAVCEYLKERGFFENILDKNHEFIFDYAIKTKDVNFVLGTLHEPEDNQRLLSYLNKIEQSLSDNGEISSYLYQWDMFELLENNDLGSNVIERLIQKKKTKLMDNFCIDIILNSEFFTFQEDNSFAELFYKSLSKPMKKYIYENDDIFQEIGTISRIERENKILRRTLNKKDLSKKNVARI